MDAFILSHWRTFWTTLAVAVIGASVGLGLFLSTHTRPLGRCIPGAHPTIVLARCADVQK